MTAGDRRRRVRCLYLPRALVAASAAIAAAGLVEATLGAAPFAGALDVLTGAVLVATWRRIARSEKASYRLLRMWDDDE